MRDNTLIVFSADNGGPPPGTNTPLRDFKGTIYEGGVRGCAFANWPGRIPAGQRIKQPMHVIDWYPTLVRLAGGSLEQKLPVDGKDVWPMLTANAPSPHESILCVQSPTRSALRMGDWKLIRFDEAAAGAGRPKNRKNVTSGTLELYNLANDSGETTNLAEREPERVALMRAKLAEYLKDAVPPGNRGDGGSE
jgi:arylsulfatase A-like enzyme